MPSRHPSPLLHHVATVAVAVIAAAVAALIILFLLLRRQLRLSRPRTAPSPAPQQSSLRRYSFSDLRRATASFSASRRLGHGAFGSVFLASFSPSSAVAVKLMDPTASLQSLPQFHNELNLAKTLNLQSPFSWSPFLVRILGYAEDKRKGDRKCIVYELMRNGSLQEKLLDERCEELMDWGKRFAVVVRVAKAIEFLHGECGVVHGDVKPSNVLLDEEFDAKLGDFGLATIVKDDDRDDDDYICVVVEDESGMIGGCDQDNETESVVTGFEEGSSVVVLDQNMSPGMSSVTATSRVVELDVEGSRSECYEKVSVTESCVEEKISVDSENNRRIGNGKKKKGGGGGGGSGRDWWWKQDNVGGFESGRVKDYVMEWIGNEIKKERPKSEWNGSSNVGDDGNSCIAKSEPKKKRRRFDWWASTDEDKLRKKERNRKPREWWKEEFCEELSKKKNKKKKKGGKSSGGSDLWWQRGEDFTPERKKKRRARSSLGSIDWWLDGLSGELRGGRRNSQDCCDIPKSGGISSTPSMRGTVCYIAPEYGSGGQLSEKCDVYSFGVLILVVLSGRRPLQVMASPMSEFDRANLISWARQLAYNGKLLDLVDPNIKSLDQEQALLCITIALLCLQRTPGKRPNMKEVVEMLTGVAEPPHLPFEFSPSPPSNFSFKSRKKAR
ncbi:hypothetical protein Drorol1_Dr00000435 [Drosera rotundifolia]